LDSDRLWLHTRAVFRQITGDDTAEIWLGRLRPVAESGDNLVVTGDERAISWARCRHLASIESAVARASGGRLGVRVVDEHVAEELVVQTSNSLDQRVADARGGAFDARNTFEQFVIGHGNRSAHAACLTVSENPGHAFNPLFIYGQPGLGKTHLLQAIGNFVKRHAPQMTTTYMTAEGFAESFRNGLGDGSLREFKERLRGSDVLLIDDVQFLQSKARTEEEFFHTFNALMESGRQLVVTCDRVPRELTAMAERMRDRFESGLVVEIEAPDVALLKTILRKRLATDGVDLPNDDALERIALRVPRNVRSLEGALIRVCALASLRRVPVTAELVDELLDVVYPDTTGARSGTVREIQQAVGDFFGVDEIRSSSRSRRVSHPRQVAMYLACELTGQSLPSIAAEFSRDHSTVVYARDRIDESMRVSDEVRISVEKLRVMLDPSTPKTPVLRGG
jgi:chromosomal replication initiator protein